MKRINFLFAILAFISTAVFSQQKTIRYFNVDHHSLPSKENAFYYREITYDANGKPQGIVREYGLYGKKLVWEGKLLTEQPMVYDGKNVWYEYSGKLEKQAFYKNGKLEGKESTYYYKGNGEKVESYKHYKNGVLEGKAVNREYSHLSIKNYVNGKLEGKATVFNEKGLKVKESYYKNNLPDGNETVYNDNGKIRYIAHYTNGKEDNMITYYPNGRLESNQQFSADVNASTLSVWYYTNGKLRMRHQTKDGIRAEEIYFHNGKLSEKKRFVNNKQDGEFVAYYDNGEKRESGFYKNGEETTHISYSVNGKINFETYTEGKNTKEKRYSQNGILIGEKNTIKGKNTTTDYDENGKIILQTVPHKSQQVHPVKNRATCLFGFKNRKKQWVLKPQFDTYKNVHNYFMVHQNGKYGVLDYIGATVIPFLYDSIELLPNNDFEKNDVFDDIDDASQFFFPNEFFKVSQHNLWGIVNHENKIIVPIEYDDIDTENEGLVVIKKNNVYGFSDLDGNIVAPKYKFLSQFNKHGFAFISDSIPTHIAPGEDEKKLTFGAINHKGETIIPCKYNYISELREGNLIILRVGREFSAYNLKTQKLIPFGNFDGNYPYRMSPYEDILSFTRDKKQYLFNGDGESLGGPYDSIVPLENHPEDSIQPGIMIVLQNNKWSVIDHNGHAAISQKYDQLNAIDNFRKDCYDDVYKLYYIARQKNKYGIIDCKGNILFPFKYTNITYEGNSWKKPALLMFDGKNLSATQPTDLKEKMPLGDVCQAENGLITYRIPDPSGSDSCTNIFTLNGKLFLPKGYFGHLLDENFIAFKNSNGNRGIMDLKKKVVLQPAKYDDISMAASGFALLTTSGGKVGLFNLEKNETAVDTVFSSIGILEPQNVVVMKGLEITNSYQEPFGAAIVNTDKKVGIYDLINKKLLLDTIFDAVTRINSIYNLAWVKPDLKKAIIPDEVMNSFDPANYTDSIAGGWGLFSTTKRQYLLPAEYDFPVVFTDSITTISKNNELGVINYKGEFILPCKYQEIRKQKNGNFFIRNNYKWGLALPTGQILIKPQWDDATDFQNGYAAFWTENKIGIIDSKGKIVVPPTNNFQNQRKTWNKYFVFAKEKEANKLPEVETDNSQAETITADSVLVDTMAIAMADTTTAPDNNTTSNNQVEETAVPLQTEADTNENQPAETSDEHDADSGIKNYNLLESFFKKHPNKLLRTKLDNAIISHLLVNDAFSSDTDTYNYPYRHFTACINSGDIYLNSNYVDSTEEYENQTNTSSSSSVYIESMLPHILSLRIEDQINSSCTHCHVNEQTITRFVNYGITPNDSVFKLTLGDLFSKKAPYKEVLNKLINEYLDKQESADLNCSNRTNLIDMFNDDFTITAQGLNLYFNNQNDNDGNANETNTGSEEANDNEGSDDANRQDEVSTNDSDSTPSFTIPFAALKSIANPKGVLSDRLK